MRTGSYEYPTEWYPTESEGSGRQHPGGVRPERWAGVSSAREEVRSVPGRRVSTCKGPEVAGKTRRAFWNEQGQKCLGKEAAEFQEDTSIHNVCMQQHLI